MQVIGGKHLYDQQKFLKNGIDIHFLNTTHQQFNNNLNISIKNLSIVDLMMNNHKSKIKQLLEEFSLV